MGCYINPKDMSKETWLVRNGILCTPAAALAVDFKTELPVCLMQNSGFTAAGIGYCKEEAERFAWPDGRKKLWFIVEAEKLKPFLRDED